MAIAQSNAIPDPAAALWWRGDYALALVALADQELKSPSSAAAAAADTHARQALRREPLVPFGLELLAQAANRQKNDALANQVMKTAAVLSKHGLSAEIWILTHEIVTGHRDIAMSAFDTILRGHPEVTRELSEDMAPLLDDPKTSAAIAATIASNPPWRKLLLRVMAGQEQNPLGILRLFAQIERAGGLSTEELRSFLTALIANGRYEQAYLYWLQSLTPAQLTKLGFLYNSRFEYPVSNMPYDWTFTETPGTVIETGTGDHGTSLDIGFLGNNINFANVTHDLMLNPGHYHFTGNVHADHFQNDRGLRWRIICLGHASYNDENALGTSNFVSGDLPWQSFDMPFEVPESGCRAQRLILELPARIAADRIASGVVSYAGLNILAK